MKTSWICEESPLRVPPTDPEDLVPSMLRSGNEEERLINT